MSAYNLEEDKKQLKENISILKKNNVSKPYIASISKTLFQEILNNNEKDKFFKMLSECEVDILKVYDFDVIVDEYTIKEDTSND